MSELAELMKQGKYDEVWQRCCSFIDLNPEDFMKIQRRLLSEQLVLLKHSDLGQSILKGATPTTLEELRSQVPLTSYSDYAPFLLNKNDDAMPRKPALWQYTSGKYGEYSYRWAPVTQQQLNEIEPLIFALTFFASCNQRNSFTVKDRDKMLYGMAPPPYATGTMARAFPHDVYRFLPSVEESEQMSFEERMSKGFSLALDEGLDICLAMSSVAMAIGNRFSQHGRNSNLKQLLKSPRALMRLAKGVIKSKLAHRELLPKDIWSLKALITFGIDGSIYRERIKEMWGRYPLDFHGCTEAPIIAMQTWDYRGMTFIPNLYLFEFIPEEESLKCLSDPSYQPETLMIDELKPGNYELVITSFHGGPFIRYKLGHLVKITELRNEKLNINIPQMTFLSRIDDQLDIAGFTRLSEKVIWQAIENCGIAYREWTACKEVKEDKPLLHLYIEAISATDLDTAKVADAIHEELKKLYVPYAELESFTGLRPLEITILPRNSFKNYKLYQQRAGAPLTQLKPPHLHPTEEMINLLKESPKVKTVDETEKEKAIA